MTKRAASTTFNFAKGEDEEAVLVSFPQNVPKNVENVKFGLFEQSGDSTTKAGKKRFLKAQNKDATVKYSANNFIRNQKRSEQGSQFLVGICDVKTNQITLVPVQNSF